MRNLSVLALIILSSYFQANAQKFDMGINAGMTQSFGKQSIKNNTDPIFTMSGGKDIGLGLSASLGFSKHWGMSTGISTQMVRVYIDRKDFNYPYYSGSFRSYYGHSTTQVPLNLYYQAPICCCSDIRFSAGPVLSWTGSGASGVSTRTGFLEGGTAISEQGVFSEHIDVKFSTGASFGMELRPTHKFSRWSLGANMIYMFKPTVSLDYTSSLQDDKGYSETHHTILKVQPMYMYFSLNYRFLKRNLWGKSEKENLGPVTSL